MKTNSWKHILFSFFLFIIFIASQLPAIAASPAQEEITILSSGPEGIIYEVSVPWQVLSLEPVFVETQLYTQVSLPGWLNTAIPGAPQLPYNAQIIGVPPGAEIHIRVAYGTPHTIPLEQPVLPGGTQFIDDQPLAFNDTLVLPAPMMVYEPDPLIYASHQAYPASLAEVTNHGTLRQQQIASIAAYPVQYQPGTNSLIVYETLQVEVLFGPATYQPRFAAQPDSALFEAMLQDALLNYEDAQLWRQPAEVEYLTQAGATQHLSTQRESGLPWFPPTPAWKIPITEEGFYQLTYSDLLSAGILEGDPDPANFQLFYLGEEVAIEVNTQDAGQFADGDTLRFYGLANPTKYTRETIYWLTIGTSPGQRIQTRDGTPGSADSPLSYPATRHFEENKIYVLNTPGADDFERFTWVDIVAINNPAFWVNTFEINGITSEPATLTLALFGMSSNPDINPDHHAEIFINNNKVADLFWDGRTWKIEEMDVTSLLLEGENQLRIYLPHDTGAAWDAIHVDWFKFNFNRAFIADNNLLTFDYEQPGPWLFEADGFTSGQITVYDLTDPFNVTEIINGEIDFQDPTYTLSFEDQLSSAKRYTLVESSAFKTVPSIINVLPSTFQPGTDQPKLLIIAHHAFWDAAQALAAYRAAQMTTLLVDVQDVYTHFAYGQVGVQAIRNFLAYAYANWGSSHVLLIGDGNYDPKNYLGDSLPSFIPAYLAFADPWIGETATDNRFVTFTEGNNLPNMMIGRLTVKTAQEAAGFVDKIITFEQTAQEEWPRQILAVADNADTSGNYPLISDAIISDLVPFIYSVERVYYKVTHPSINETRAAIQAGINSNKYLVSYFGHGAFDFWAEEQLFKKADVALLTNSPHYPIILAMTCYEGYFHRPKADHQALAEVVITTPGKGAVASWSSSGLGITPGHNLLTRGFYQAMFKQEVATLGQATLGGKLRLWASGVMLDMIDTHNLLGDPALHFHPQPLYRQYLPLFTR